MVSAVGMTVTLIHVQSAADGAEMVVGTVERMTAGDASEVAVRTSAAVVSATDPAAGNTDAMMAGAVTAEGGPGLLSGHGCRSRRCRRMWPPITWRHRLGGSCVP